MLVKLPCSFIGQFNEYLKSARYSCIILFYDFSYIDPGSGSLLSSALVGLSLALVFYIRALFYRIFNIVAGKKNACDSDFADQLVIFSEGRNYWPVFEPVCEELLNRGQSFVYLTAGKDDPGLDCLAQSGDQARALYLGRLNSAIYTMNRLKAKMCVMTTPQLDIMQLKRSPHVGHYCHVMHSPSDVHTYEKFAFDYFDSVLCTSQHVMNNLKLLEQKRQTEYMRKKGLLRERKLFATGCPYYQQYFADSPAAENKVLAAQTWAKAVSKAEEPCLLLASSWGARSFLNQIDLILEQLLSLPFRVIFRPHPQAWKSDKEKLERVQKQYGEHIEIDCAVDNRPVLQRADVLVCDVSGIIYDFAFVYQKPVLALFHDQVEIMGYEASDVEAPDSVFELLEDVGAYLPLEQLSCLGELLPQVMQKQLSRQLIDKHIFHFDNAGRVAAQQIMGLFQRQLAS